MEVRAALNLSAVTNEPCHRCKIDSITSIQENEIDNESFRHDLVKDEGGHGTETAIFSHLELENLIQSS